jgi:hypothetical protein
LTATALAKVTPGAHLSALYRELRERAEEAERERARPAPFRACREAAVFPPTTQRSLRSPSSTPRSTASLPTSSHGLIEGVLVQVLTVATSATPASPYLYSEKVRAGSRRLAEEIAEQLGGDYDAKRVRHMISQARHKGFLTGTERGRARGELTEKGREVLREGREAVANARRQRRANDAETHVPDTLGTCSNRHKEKPPPRAAFLWAGQDSNLRPTDYERGPVLRLSPPEAPVPP